MAVEILKKIFVVFLRQVISSLVKFLCITHSYIYIYICTYIVGGKKFMRQSKCVTRYVETQSITTFRRLYQHKYGETPPVRNTILRWVNNFNSEGNLENRTGRGRPPENNSSMCHSLWKCVRLILLWQWNSEKKDYCELLDTYVRNESENFPENALLQQDGAPTHTSQDARDLLRENFRENWMR